MMGGLVLAGSLRQGGRRVLPPLNRPKAASSCSGFPLDANSPPPGIMNIEFPELALSPTFDWEMVFDEDSTKRYIPRLPESDSRVRGGIPRAVI